MDKELPDRISDLPDDILDKILSSVPIREVARTSVLSTRWRNTWKSVSGLVFDRDIYNSYNRDVYDSSRDLYTSFRYLSAKLLRDVDRVLSLVHGPIRKFELSSQSAIPVADIDKWVFFLSKHPLEELMLDVPNAIPSSTTPFSPTSAFLLKSLTDLATRLPHLRILNIQCILFEDLASRHVPKSLPTPFANLHYLSVNVKFTYAKHVQALASFLRSSPILEELHILCYQSLHDNTNGDEWSAKNWDHPFARLRRIRVEEFGGLQEETRFIEFMLLFSPVLVKMDVELAGNRDIHNERKFEIWKEVTELERASLRAEILVTDPYGPPPQHHRRPQPQALMGIFGTGLFGYDVFNRLSL